MIAAPQRFCGTGQDFQVRNLIVKAALWLAGVHTSCATFWNDVADAVLTRKSISSIRKHRETGHD
jgi:hypothetical protein